jgi:hypothetical protein
MGFILYNIIKMSRLLSHTITPIQPESESLADVVTLQEAKDYCRVDFNEDNSLFARLIASSRLSLQEYTGRVFLAANCTAIYVQEGCGDRVALYFSDNIELPVGSTYTDLLIGDSYLETTESKVSLTYTAGYTAASVPEWMKHAVLMDVAYKYENRGDVAVSSSICTEVKEYLKPFVKWSLI